MKYLLTPLYTWRNRGLWRFREVVQGHTVGRQWSQELCVKSKSPLPLGLVSTWNLESEDPPCSSNMGQKQPFHNNTHFRQYWDRGPMKYLAGYRNSISNLSFCPIFSRRFQRCFWATNTFRQLYIGRILGLTSLDQSLCTSFVIALTSLSYFLICEMAIIVFRIA